MMQREFQFPESKPAKVQYRHLKKVWTIPELARHYGTTYKRMAAMVNSDKAGVYVRLEPK